MKGMLFMQSHLHLVCKSAIFGLLIFGVTSMAGASDKTIIESVRAMEREFSVTITDHFNLVSRIRHAQHIPDNYLLNVSTASPSGGEIAWSSYPVNYNGEKIPFLTVQSLREGMQSVQVEGLRAIGMAVSSGATVIIAIASPVDPTQSRNWKLLAIDRRTELVVHDLTRFLTQFRLGNNIADIRVSQTGSLLALGSSEPEQIQVLEVPSGKTVYTGPGSSPRLSPDGKRIAFINQGTIWIYSFADGSTVPLLKGKRVKGLGGWSPDGRFLLAGAWTTPLALEKRQIIVDATTGRYTVISKLGEGNYGTTFAWVSTNLLDQLYAKRSHGQS